MKRKLLSRLRFDLCFRLLVSFFLYFFLCLELLEHFSDTFYELFLVYLPILASEEIQEILLLDEKVVVFEEDLVEEDFDDFEEEVQAVGELETRRTTQSQGGF